MPLRKTPKAARKTVTKKAPAPPPFWDNLKREAFELLRTGESARTVATSLKVDRTALRGWAQHPEWQQEWATRDAELAAQGLGLELSFLQTLHARGLELINAYIDLALKSTDDRARATLLKDAMERLGVRPDKLAGSGGWEEAVSEMWADAPELAELPTPEDPEPKTSWELDRL